MYEFTTTIKAGSNFRPSALIYQHAKEHGFNTVDCYGSTCLVMGGNVYGYSAYRIQPIGDGFENVTVIMNLKSKAEN